MREANLSNFDRWRMGARGKSAEARAGPKPGAAALARPHECHTRVTCGAAGSTVYGSSRLVPRGSVISDVCAPLCSVQRTSIGACMGDTLDGQVYDN